MIILNGNEEAVALCKDQVSLISATGSTRMGKELAPLVSARLGGTLLELGGNNAAIICASADLFESYLFNSRYNRTKMYNIEEPLCMKIYDEFMKKLYYIMQP